MPRSREQNALIREQAKNNILQKSVAFFAKNGVKGTTIGELTKGIGISQGAIYVYYDSKEDLYQDVVLFARGKILSESLLEIEKMNVPAIRKLRYISDMILKNLSEEKLYASYLYLALDPFMKSGFSKEENPFFDLMKSVIKEGQKDGAFAKGDVVKTAEYFWSVVYIYSMKKVHDPKCTLLTSSELERVIRG